MRKCKNCDVSVHTPDPRTGLIHTNGKYVCGIKFNNKRTVAE